MRAVLKAAPVLQSRNTEVNQSLSSRNRILRSEGFDGVLKGRRIRGVDFNAFMQSNSCGVARLGIVVSKRDFPLAFRRNRIKRKVREAFRCHPIKQRSVDLVLIARPQAASGFADIQGLLNRVDRECGTF